MKHLTLTKPMAVIDLETTGLNKQEDRIVDICVIKILPNGEEVTLKSLINPTMPIPPESTQIHGIKDEDIQGKPTFKEFAEKITNFIENCDLCGYGIKFDFEILKSEFERVGIVFSKEGRVMLDVKDIYFKLEPRDLSSAYLKYCGKELEDAHRADNDVKATIKVLEAQLNQHDELPREISALKEFCNPKNPSWIDDDGKFAWSDGKSIINFGNHEGKTLEHMSKNEQSYLRWIISKDFSSEVKQIVNEAIDGRFPEPENDILHKK